MDMIVKVTPEMQKRIAEFCKEMGIAKLALFDPDLQGRPNPHVDVYALIEFAPGVKGTDFSWWYGELEVGLEEIIGYRTGVRTAIELHPAFRDEIVAMVKPQYEQA